MRKKIKSVTIEFSPNKLDMHEHVAQQKSKDGYLKELIRQDMEK